MLAAEVPPGICSRRSSNCCLALVRTNGATGTPCDNLTTTGPAKKKDLVLQKWGRNQQLSDVFGSWVYHFYKNHQGTTHHSAYLSFTSFILHFTGWGPYSAIASRPASANRKSSAHTDWKADEKSGVVSIFLYIYMLRVVICCSMSFRSDKYCLICIYIYTV